MRRKRGRRPSATWGKRGTFQLTQAARDRLALILRPKVRDLSRLRAIIQALEDRASDFFETVPFAAANADPAVDEALRRLAVACTAQLDALRAIPSKARTILLEQAFLNRTLPPNFLSRVAEDTKMLRGEAVRVRWERKAQRRDGGRPSDRRGCSFAIGIAEILKNHKVPPTKYKEGLLAECIEILFEAVKHPMGDIGTLLKASVEAVRK